MTENQNELKPLRESFDEWFYRKFEYHKNKADLYEAFVAGHNTRATSQAEQSLDERMKAAGMSTVAEMLERTIMDKFIATAGVNTLADFENWLQMRRKEMLGMQARMTLGKQEGDELYEWVIAHVAVLGEVMANFRQVTDKPSQAERQIEDLQYALVRLILLKDHKDKHGKDSYYQTWQPKAWAFARGVLKKEQQVHPAERQIEAIRAALEDCRNRHYSLWKFVGDVEKILEEGK